MDRCSNGLPTAREQHGVQTRVIVQDLTDPTWAPASPKATRGLDVHPTAL
jgi:hypothetical protein